MAELTIDTAYSPSHLHNFFELVHSNGFKSPSSNRKQEGRMKKFSGSDPPRRASCVTSEEITGDPAFVKAPARQARLPDHGISRVRCSGASVSRKSRASKISAGEPIPFLLKLPSRIRAAASTTIGAVIA